MDIQDSERDVADRPEGSERTSRLGVSMSNCGSCGSEIATGAGACPVCGAVVRLPHGGGGAPQAAVSRWLTELDQSPVFAHEADPPPVVEPVPAGLDVEIVPSFELHSAPGDVDPDVHLLLTLTPRGPPLVDPTSGPVAHVVLALDLSASMNRQDKYPVLLSAISNMLDDLRRPGAGEVLLSMIVFAYGAEVLFRAVPASELGAAEVLAAIDGSSLKFGRYTDIVGALGRAGRIALDSHRTDKVMPVRICLLTDGKPQDMEGAARVMERVARLPVDVEGLCFGDDADVESLQSLIAGGRGGTVKHVRKDTLRDAFGHIAESAQRVVAKRSLLSLDLAAGVVGGAAYRYRPGRHAYGDGAFEEGTSFQTDLGTLEGDRSCQLLFQIRLPQAAGSETEVGRVTLRVPGFGGPTVFEHVLCIPRHPGKARPDPDPAVVEARAVVEALGNDDGEATLRALRVRRRVYLDEHRDPHLIELIDRAIAEIEGQGTLDGLSENERSALLAHTCSVGSGKPQENARGLSFE